jgi:protease-4
MVKKLIWIVVGMFICFSMLMAGLWLGSGDLLQMSFADGVGVVEVRGVILDSRDTVRQLRDLRKNDRVKAIVLRIDSPGGVVAPSQEISEEVRKLAAVKRVVVSMGSVAASGGYYIAVPATKIYANPGTITGSIGVLMKFSNVEGLLGKVGMKSFTLKTGPYKDAGSPVRPMTAEERALLQGVIDTAHGQFVRSVSEGRKLPIDEVRKIADGRILTGEQALTLKLVDRLGTLQDAIEEAGRLGGVKGEPEVILPPAKQRKLIDLLVEETVSRVNSAAVYDRHPRIDYIMGGVLATEK